MSSFPDPSNVLETATRQKHSLDDNWKYLRFKKVKIQGGNGYLYEVFFEKLEEKAQEWSGRWLTRQEMNDLIQALVDTGHCDALSALLSGISKSYTSQFDMNNGTRSNMMHVLHNMNEVPCLQDGDIPMKAFIENAAYLTNPYLQGSIIRSLLKTKFSS
ncbi:MAG: hypothetical protein AAGM67_03075 [Bacteroidota bacterium]